MWGAHINSCMPLDCTCDLQELIEDIEEYDRAIYSRRTPLERMGGTHMPGPWGRQ